MSLIDYKQVLRDTVKSLQPEDDPAQLAYLALTSKCEHAVRDRMALLLRQRHSEIWCIARELIFNPAERDRARADSELLKGLYGRRKGGIDLAVLDRQSERVIATLELKQIYGFDFIEIERPLAKHPELVKTRRDIAMQRLASKAFGLPQSECPVLLLVFDVTPQVTVQPLTPLPRFLKYATGHQRRFNWPGRAWAEAAEQFLQLGFWDKDAMHGTTLRLAEGLDCGAAEGFEVSLDAWLLQPG